MNSKRIEIILVIFILLSIGGGVFLYLNDSKIKFVTLLNKEYRSFMTMVDDIKNSKIATLSKDTTLTANSNISFDVSLNKTIFGDSANTFNDVIKGLAINLQYGIDNTNDNAFIKLDSSLNNKAFIAADLYQIDNKSYVYLDGIYDKYIRSNSTNIMTKQNKQIDDVSYLTDKIKKSFISALKTSDFTNEKVTIKINDQNINTDKMTFTLTNNRLIEILKKVLTNIKDDDKCISTLEKMNDSKEDIKASLEKYIAALDSKKLLTEDVKINMYIANGSITKLEIYEGTIKYFEYFSYISGVTTKVRSISIYDDNAVTLVATFKAISKNDVLYQLSFLDNTILVDGSISKIVTETIPNKEFKVKVNLNSSLNYSGINFGTIKIYTDTIIKIGEKIDTVDMNNVVDEEYLTEQEQSDILSKLLQKIVGAIPQIETNTIETNTGNAF